jgi:hypothetical protein
MCLGCWEMTFLYVVLPQSHTLAVMMPRQI